MISKWIHRHLSSFFPSYIAEQNVVSLQTLSPRPSFDENTNRVGVLSLRIVGMSCSPPLTRRNSLASSSKSDLFGSPTSTPRIELIPHITDISIKASSSGDEMYGSFTGVSCSLKNSEEEQPVQIEKLPPRVKTDNKSRESDIYSVFDNHSFNLQPLVDAGVMTWLFHYVLVWPIFIMIELALFDTVCYR